VTIAASGIISSVSPCVATTCELFLFHRRSVRRAEWDNVNKVILDGIENNNSKPFWNYIKWNIFVKEKRNLLSDATYSAEILMEQFQSVFTKSTNQQNLNQHIQMLHRQRSANQVS
jgi:hypothetical protein